MQRFDITKESYYCVPETPEALNGWIDGDSFDIPELDEILLPQDVIRTAARHVQNFLAVADEILYFNRLQKMVSTKTATSFPYHCETKTGRLTQSVLTIY